MKANAEVNGYFRIVVVLTTSCLAMTLLALALHPASLSAQETEVSSAQQSSEQSLELTELLDRMRGFSRRGLFGGGGAARHVRNAAGQITQLRLEKVELQPGDARLISGLDHLGKLDLRDSNVSDEDIRELESLQSLKELLLRGTKISGIAVASVGRMREVTRLDLSRTKISDRDLRHLRGLLNLNYLQLDRTPITDAGLEVLGGMPQLARISLGGTKVTDAGMRYLMRLPRLRGLTLNDTKVTGAGLNQIAKIPGFEWIAAPDRVANEFVQRLELTQFDAAREMFAAGVTIPERGNYRLLSLEPIDLTDNDQKRGWQRFKIRLHWIDRAKKTDEIMLVRIAVDRGAVLIMEVSIDDDER